MLEYRILGPVEVVTEHGPVRLGGLRQRATLAILLLNANRVVSVERLADDLYTGAAPVTAVTQVQRQVSELRKLLGPEAAIETRPPGYVMRISSEQLDLTRFEQWTEEAHRLLARGAARCAVDLLRNALDLWRGAPLADLAAETFARPAIDRLEELRIAAIERRIDAELELGRHGETAAELEALVAEHPLREGLRRQLMLALYRAGRQAEALEVYRRGRVALVEEFGIEPAPALHDLEQAILKQDRSLDLEPAPAVRGGPDADPDRAVLVLSSSEGGLDGLLAIAEPLARLPGRELIIARLLGDEREFGSAASAMNIWRSSLPLNARTAAFTTTDWGGDAVRLALTYDVDLVLVDSPPGLVGRRIPQVLAAILERSPADVAVLTGAVDLGVGDGIFVPFGGGEHDWAAVEQAAWVAAAAGAPLRIVGTKADPRHGQRDASRLLADASLAVQRVIGVAAEPLLAEPSEEALVAAVDPATLVVVGISPRWRREGIGAVRRVLVGTARPPLLLVHRGPRPSGLAPRESRTRFTWSIEG